jgi:hypothetical protein
MARRVSPSEVYEWLTRELARRPEFGLWKAIINLLLEPPSPFDAKSRRKPKVWAVIAGLLLGVSLWVFLYFNVFS